MAKLHDIENMNEEYNAHNFKKKLLCELHAFRLFGVVGSLENSEHSGVIEKPLLIRSSNDPEIQCMYIKEAKKKSKST